MNTRDMTGFLHEWMTRILSRKSRKKCQSRPARAFFGEKSTKNTTCHSHENRCLPGGTCSIFSQKMHKKSKVPGGNYRKKFSVRIKIDTYRAGFFQFFAKKCKKKSKSPAESFGSNFLPESKSIVTGRGFFNFL